MGDETNPKRLGDPRLKADPEEARRRALMGGGRPKGSVNKKTKTAQKIAYELLTAPDYLTNLQLRLKAGILPPMVETMLWNYAFGCPKQRVEVSPAPDLSALTPLELAARADEIRQEILQEVEEEEAKLAEQSQQAASDALLSSIPNATDRVQ